MLNKFANNQAPLFYTPRTTENKFSIGQKLHQRFIKWRINQLQNRIEQIQEALDFELRQNHSSKKQLELTAHAHQFCLGLAHKQQRLLQRHR